VARFGTFVYGDGTLYGTSPTTSNYLWTFVVDWDGDGYFSGANEAEQMVGLSTERGRDDMLGDKGFEPMGIGKAVALFDNSDRRYDPRNTSSPLYPYVKPGKFTKIAVKDGSTGTNYGVMQGIIDDIQPVNVQGIPHARITVLDGLRWLANQRLRSELLTGPTITEIVEAVLDEVAWPWTIEADGSVLMAETKDYWWAWDQTAYAALRELGIAEAATMFHDRDGALRFLNRDYTHTRTKAVAQSVIMRDIATPQPWENVRNEIRVNAYPKSVDTTNNPPLFRQQNNTPQVPAWGTAYVDATYKFQDFRLAGQDVLYGFFVYRTSDDADITASCTLTYSPTNGGGTRFVVKNNTADDAYVGVLLMTAGVGSEVIYATNKSAQFARNTASQAEYGPRAAVFDSYWQESSDTGQDIADWLLAEIKDANLFPTIQFENRPDYQFYLDLWDRVELNIDELDISENFRVGKIKHDWLTANGQAVRTLVQLEPYLTPFA